MTKKGRPWFRFGNKLSETLNDILLSMHFGWTPNEIKNIPIQEKMKYIAFLQGWGNAKLNQNGINTRYSSKS